MALVNVTNVVVLDNPTTFTNPLTFEVTFECLQELDAGELRILLLSISFYLRTSTTFLFALKVQLIVLKNCNISWVCFPNVEREVGLPWNLMVCCSSKSITDGTRTVPGASSRDSG